MGIVTDVFLPLALAFIMFALGLGLTGADFLRVAKQPRDFLVGALSQIIILPIIAFTLVKLWPISPELAVGVMIIAAAPGGATSNILTSFAKGDVAFIIESIADNIVWDIISSKKIEGKENFHLPLSDSGRQGIFVGKGGSRYQVMLVFGFVFNDFHPKKDTAQDHGRNDPIKGCLVTFPP